MRLALSASIVALTAAASATAGAYFVRHTVSKVNQVDIGGDLTPTGGKAASGKGDSTATTDPGPAPTKIENYLLVGNDTRIGADPNDPDFGSIGAKDTGLNSDTIMVARFDPATGATALLSIPRDTYVEIQTANPFKDRINGAFGEGRDVLVRTIQKDLGIPINHYVEVNFEGFRKIVDAIGGVAMYLDVPVRDTHTGLDLLHPGCHTLDGVQARQWVRSRYLEYWKDGKWRKDESSDYGRMSRQQDFVKRAFQKVLAKSANPIVAAQVIDAVASNLTVEQGFNPRALAKLARSMAGATIDTYTLPTSPKKIGGKDVLQLDTATAGPILDYFKGVTNDQPVANLPANLPAGGQGAAGLAPVVVPVPRADVTTTVAPSTDGGPPSTTPSAGIVPDTAQDCS